MPREALPEEAHKSQLMGATKPEIIKVLDAIVAALSEGAEDEEW